MNSRISVLKHGAVAIGLALGISMAHAADGLSFAQQNEYWQALSTSMPAGSPQVDRSVRPADPIPSARGTAQEIARFQQMDATLQAESTNLPAGSPRVDKSQAAADPIPKATTLAQKEARFAAEDRFLEQNSTP